MDHMIAYVYVRAKNVKTSSLKLELFHLLSNFHLRCAGSYSIRIAKPPHYTE